MKKNQTTFLTPSHDMMSSAVKAALAKVSAEKSASSAKRVMESIQTGISKTSVGVAASASARLGGGTANAQSIPLTKQMNDDAVLLNEKQQREAALARQLPADFPIENWEKLPAKAQLFQMRYSGLSEQDQWALLNASAPLKVLAAANVSTPTGTRSGNGSGKQQVPFSGQDAETQRAEQRASRKATDVYNQLNQALASKNVDTNSLSSAGNDIYRSTRIAMAYEVLQGTLDSSKQSRMINDAKAGIAPGKTSPTTMRDWNVRVSLADTASKELMDTLDSMHVDTDNLTTPQSYIIEKAERMLRDGIISGTLTEAGKNEMIRRICNQVTSETTPPKGVTYVTLMDPKLNLKNATTKKEELMIRRGTAFNQAGLLLEDALKGINVDTGKLSDQQERIILAEQQNLADGMLDGSIKGNAISAFVDNVCYRIATETTPPPGVTYVRILDPSYQPKIQSAERISEINAWLVDDEIDTTKFTNEQKMSYANAQQKIRNGAIKGLLTDEYVDHIYSTLINELSSKELRYEYTDARGRKAEGITTTKDLIDPEDDSIGAKIARAALELYGEERYADIFMTNSQGESFSKKLDCSKLVYYAINKYYPNFVENKLGEAAEYQRINTGKKLNPNNVVWRNDASKDFLDINKLKPGDLLYWATSDGEVVHTAIYLSNGLMIEANDFVEIGEVREFTDYGDGSGSSLVQVNRLPEME